MDSDEGEDEVDWETEEGEEDEEEDEEHVCFRRRTLALMVRISSCKASSPTSANALNRVDAAFCN